MKINEIIKTGSDAWMNLQSEITERFNPGDVIAHEWLKGRFNFQDLKFSEFTSEEEFKKAYDLQSFAYLTLTQNLYDELLKNFNVCLKNVWSEGYTIVKPEEQCQYGFDLALKEIKKAIRESDMIMKYRATVNQEQQTTDNNLKAKMAMLSGLMKNIKKNDIKFY